MNKKPIIHAVDGDGDQLVERLDAWRRLQPDIPARAKAIRELMRRALRAEERLSKEPTA